MSTPHSLAESIHGAWYYLPETFDIQRGHQHPHQTLFFRTDGTFSRYQIKKKYRKFVETGDYTYDGNFLILRARNTDTYRVHPRHHWKWLLEASRKNHLLLRTLLTEDAFFALDKTHLRDIRILPLRARIVDDDFDGEHLIYRVFYPSHDQNELHLATFFVENQPEGHRHIGITPVAQGIELATWERIIREAFLDIHCKKPDDVTIVTVRLLPDNQSRVFNYQIPH